MNKNTSKILLKSFLVFLGFVLSLQAIAVWTGAPDNPPPLNNVLPPINVSDTLQDKAGALRSAGFRALNGDVYADLRLGVRESGASPTFWTYFQGGNQSGDITYTLPNSLSSTVGTYILNTDENGIMSWTTPNNILNVSSGKLLGRYATTNGAIQEITISTGLDLDENGNLTSTVSGMPSFTTDDTVLVANGSAWQIKSIPDCDDVNGKHLNYDTSTNEFTCGNSASLSQGSFPSLRAGGSSFGSDNTRNTTHTISLPNITSGDLIIAFVNYDFNPAGSISPEWPSGSGWTQLFINTQITGSTTNVFEVRYKIASSNESATNINITTGSVAGLAAYQVYSFYNFDSSVPIEYSLASGNSLLPNSPNLVPSWGYAKNLWISALGLQNGGIPETIVQYPSNYSGGLRVATTEGSLASTGSAQATSMRNNLETSSENPSEHFLTQNDYWIAATIAIKGAP